MSLATGPLALGTALLVAGVPLVLAGTPRALAAQALGVGALGVAGIVLLADGATEGDFHDALSPTLGADPLTGAFLLLLAIVALPALLVARDALGDGARDRWLAALTAGFLLAMALLLLARDPTTLLASWELMSVLPAAAMLVARPDAPVRRAVLVYLGIAHLGGAGVWAAVLLLASEGALGGAPLGAGGLQPLVLAVGIVGFGTKAGLVPLHPWLPRAHPVAPPFVSALMSGAMVALALYGLTRLLLWWTVDLPAWPGIALVAVGAASALVGVLWALVERDLKRVLAFSTIEHAGIATAALGAAVLLRAAGHETAALAAAAALLHLLGHAAYKGGLFLGAGVVAGAAGTTDLDAVGGLLRRMPWAGGALALCLVAIAGLPPLVGFASEWLVLQSLVRLVLADGVGATAAITGALALVALAAVAALALLCFVRVLGLLLLGEPRGERVAAATEPQRATRAGLLLAAAAAVVLGALAGVLVEPLADAVAGGGGPLTAGAAIDLDGTGGYPALGLPVALALVVGLLWWLRGGRRAAPAPAWACGQPPDRALGWTSAGFTKTAQLLLGGLLRPERRVAVRTEGGVVQAVEHESRIDHPFDRYLLEPVVRGGTRAAARLRRLQSGWLGGYLLFLVGLLVLLLALLRIGAFT